MLQKSDFYKNSYENKISQLISIFNDINQQYNIHNEDFLYLLKNVSQISEDTLNFIYTKLFDLKEKGKDTHFLKSEIKQSINELKYILNNSENENNLLNTIDNDDNNR